MKYSIAALVLGFFAALSVAAPAPTPADDVDPNQVYIEALSYAGSGCKAGTAAISKSADARTVTIAFDSYVASIGPGVPFVDRRKNCNLNVKLHYPGGFQYTLYQTDYTGYADLEVGVTATQRSTYWFAGFLNERATLQTTWYGAFVNNYAFRDVIGHDAWVWSPCGASTNLNIDTQLTLANNPASASGFITTDTIDHKVKTIFGVRWRRC
ncbi:hypothetical protein L873DRAFT_621952 [Choiromyces venosus 120613-1]|uniref:DUF4360 domain-containing protein n=1 Tax=Choiromyces venosus 120613-1 TaxID=1336337 RepID=A0A3N4IUU6_9PEZI|nr:hypothetical protein L873DRAFT_621952 [Choiromyces venosus 120613-1]